MLHLPPGALARVLDRAGPLLAVVDVHGARPRADTIRVAVPDRDLLVAHHRIALSAEPTESGHRLGVRSVALALGQRAIGLLLSGVLDDGVAGSASIRAQGTTTIAESATAASFGSLPLDALAAGLVDRAIPDAEMGDLLTDLAARKLAAREMEPGGGLELESRTAMSRPVTTGFDSDALGMPSGFIYSDCDGPLITLNERDYRCGVGHAWTAKALPDVCNQEVDRALAIGSSTEKADLARRLAQGAGSERVADCHTQPAAEAEHAVSVLSDRLGRTHPVSGEDSPGGDSG